MISLLLFATALADASVPARGEDAAHRADRLRTIELNRRAKDAIARRDRGNSEVREANRRDAERYERQLRYWRERVAACRAGDEDACAR